MAGSRSLDEALDALVELLVDHWLETEPRRESTLRLAAMPMDVLQGAGAGPAETVA